MAKQRTYANFIYHDFSKWAFMFKYPFSIKYSPPYSEAFRDTHLWETVQQWKWWTRKTELHRGRFPNRKHSMSQFRTLFNACQQCTLNIPSWHEYRRWLPCWPMQNVHCIFDKWSESPQKTCNKLRVIWLVMFGRMYVKKVPV